MEAIKQLKELFDEGLMTKEEYDERRLQVINEMTLTEYDGSAGGSSNQVLLEDDGAGDRWGTGEFCKREREREKRNHPSFT